MVLSAIEPLDSKKCAACTGAIDSWENLNHPSQCLSRRVLLEFLYKTHWTARGPTSSIKSFWHTQSCTFSWPLGQMSQDRSSARSPFQAPRVESMLASKLPLLTQPHCSEHIIYLLGLRDHFRIFSKACETFHPADCWGSWSWWLVAPRSRVVRLSLHARQLVCALASAAHGGFWEQTKTGGLKAV